MLKDYIVYSFRNLARRRLRSWLTMIGIFIGIAAVVSLIGLGEGLRVAISSQFGNLGTDVLSVQASGIAFAGPPGQGAANPLTDDLAEKIDKISGVETAFNRYIQSGTLEFNDRQGIGMAVNVPPGETRKIIYKMLNLEVEEGRLLKDGDQRKCIIGSDVAKSSTFGKQIKAGDNVLISDIKYQVVGVLKKKGSFILDSVVLINDDPFLEDFRDPDDDTVNIIAVKVKDESQIHQIKEDVEKLMRKERDVKEGEEDFTVKTPHQTLETLNSTLFAVQLFVYIIASISILVGGIGIMNTMYTAVVERTKEIGIMKSIGAKNSSIFTMFAVESGWLGMVGGLIGVILGLIFAYGLAAAGRQFLGSEIIQAHVDPLLVLGALFFSFLIGTVAGVLPAYQASKLHPVDALHYK